MMLPQTFLSAAYGILGFGHNHWSSQTFAIDPEPQNGRASYISKGSEGPWDGPNASLMNEMNFKWWYLDAHTKNGDQGVAVGFMNSNPARFGLDLPTSNWFIFHARFEDGTGLNTVVPAGAPHVFQRVLQAFGRERDQAGQARRIFQNLR
jgi:hypothetical protein